MANERLDLTSEHFDANACLTEPDLSKVTMPYPNISDLRTIRRCTNMVPVAIREEVDREFGLKPKVCDVQVASQGIACSHRIVVLSDAVSSPAPTSPALVSAAAQLPTHMQEKSEEEKARDAAKKAFMCQRAAEYMKSVQQAAEYDPIQTIIQRVRKGPLMLLRRAYQSTVQIDVVTRHARGIKGILRAEVHGFDKFMNLLLADVEEWLAHRVRVRRIKPKPGQGPEKESVHLGNSDADKDAAGQHLTDASGDQSEVNQPAQRDRDATAASLLARGSPLTNTRALGATSHGHTQTRVGWQQVLRRRKLSRVLLRGDQVVLISLASGPMRLPSSISHLAPADDGRGVSLPRVP
jgi:small nuclear ribonucleoprotein (snRNP)-like protein